LQLKMDTTLVLCEMETFACYYTADELYGDVKYHNHNALGDLRDHSDTT